MGRLFLHDERQAKRPTQRSGVGLKAIKKKKSTKARGVGPFDKLRDRGSPAVRSVSLPAVSQPNPSNWPI